MSGRFWLVCDLLNFLRYNNVRLHLNKANPWHIKSQEKEQSLQSEDMNKAIPCYEQVLKRKTAMGNHLHIHNSAQRNKNPLSTYPSRRRRERNEVDK